MRKYIYLFSFLVFFQVVFGQKSVDVQISKKQVEVGEDFVVQYNIHNIAAKDFKPPVFGELQLVGGPQQSSSTNMSFVNGSMKREEILSLTYYFRAPKIGKFKIGKAVVISNTNETFETGEITVEAVKAAPQAQQSQGGGGVNTSNVDLKKDIYAKIILNKNSAYVGEQITATIKVYTSVNLNGFEPTKVPNFNGFWSQNIKMPQQITPTREVIGGKPFLVFEVQKIILFPNKAGTLEISPLEVKTTAIVPVQVQRRRPNRQPRDWFEYMEMQMEEMMGGMSQQYEQIPHTFTTGTAKIQVRDLPTKNKPADFSGAVGKFNFTTTIDKTTCKTDDAVTLKMNIEGSGSLPLMEAPVPNFSQDFELYDPVITDNFNAGENFTGSKRVEYVAIPHMPGEFKIPPTSFSYFDISKNDYVTIQSPEYVLTITGKPSTASKFVSGNMDKEDIKLIGKDIRFIHKNAAVETVSADFFNSGKHFAMMGFPFVLLLGLLLVRKRFHDLESDAIYMGNKRATKIARARLNNAKKFLDKNDKASFYNEVVRGVNSYVGNKFQIDPSNISRDNIAQTLASRNIDSSTIDTVIQVIDNCEMSLFSPVSSDDMAKTYEDAVQLITRIEAQA
ncbi:MAG: protein BatD [Chitinophagales bacterium]|nr:protein BatD [Chitinophagales bacterium]